MTKEEIIYMACQAFGGVIKKEERDNFIAFAKLVAEKELKKASERVWIALTNKGAVWHLKQMCTDAIEARGEECTK